MVFNPEKNETEKSLREKGVELHIAALRGDWEHALSFEAELDSKITDKSETVLHIAAAAKQSRFVYNLVNRFKNMDTKTGDCRTLRLLEAENSSGNTALCYAAATGIIYIAKAMIDAYEEVYYKQKYRKEGSVADMLPNRGQIKPVSTAAVLGHGDMVEFLLEKTDIDRGWSEMDRAELFISCIAVSLYDTALRMLTSYPELAMAHNESGEAALHVLARKSSDVVVDETRRGWRKYMDSCTRAKKSQNKSCNKEVELVRELCKRALSNDDLEAEDEEEGMTIIAQSLLIAAEEGNTNFVIELLRFDPNLIWKVHPHKGSIFHIAVRHRHEDIFSLIYELGSIKDLIVTNTVTGQNSILHLAAELSPKCRLNDLPGPAFQMQRELIWFKEVEKIVQPSFRGMKNQKEKTPEALFNEKHRELRRAGEKWMKETARACMAIGMLISIVTFIAPFALPRNLVEEKKNNIHLVFAMFDTLALICSSISILMFLSVLSSGFPEQDFFRSLPRRLLIGVASLFASLVAMAAAFLASIYIHCPVGHPWICAVLLFPVLYVGAKHPLLFNSGLYRSTFGSCSMGSHRRLLYR